MPVHKLAIEHFDLLRTFRMLEVDASWATYLDTLFENDVFYKIRVGSQVSKQQQQTLILKETSVMSLS